MRQQDEAKVVTVDEGDGPVKLVKDTGGRLLSREQMTLVRDRQQADLDQATELHGKLTAGDAAATTDVIGQVKDRITLQLTMMDRQKTELQATLAKLEAGDAGTVKTMVGQMVQRLARRVELATQARDRSASLLAELDGAAGD
ncbi:MAG TPA: hypothetical protein PKZ08_15275 [Vicinamibacterales bacterium]|nr:hypothetical protein [Vicinamibacterales bacterium]